MNDQNKKKYRWLSKVPGYQFFMRPVLNFLLNSMNYNYREYGLITNKNHDFIYEEKFKKALNTHNKKYKPFLWETHVNLWAADYAKKLDGDFVECGVFLGCNAKSIMEYINFKNLKNKTFYLFDTFQGLDAEFSSNDELESHKDAYDDTYKIVKDLFSTYSNVEIVKGAVPKTLSNVNIEKVAYLSIDMNCVIPEVKALEFFWPKMAKGGIIILDDYGWERKAQKEAQDKFASSVGAKVLSLPTGQGVIIKH